MSPTSGIEMIRRCLQVSWLALDLAAFTFSAVVANVLLGRHPDHDSLLIVALIDASRLALFLRFGMYRTVVRFTGLHTLLVLGLAIGAGSLFGSFIAAWRFPEDIVGQRLAFRVLEALLAMVACGSSRIGARVVSSFLRRRHGQRVLILGAGILGEMALRSLQAGGMRVVALLDDDARKHGLVIHGRKVLGSIDRLAMLLQQLPVDLAVIAIRDLPQARLKDIFHLCMHCRLRVKVIKGLDQIVDERGDTKLEDIHLEDLLRRPPRNLDQVKVRAMVSGQTVLVTGAGGSIGSELCRQIADMMPRRLLLLDHSEHNLYEIDTALRDDHASLEIVPLLASLCDRGTLAALLAQHRPQVVFHAAAYKHVPMVEANPFPGVINNVAGTLNLIAEADAAGVDRLVVISSDKAVRPTNVMGASKRVCELLLQNYPTRRTKLCAVRFGNVLGSSGSVVPRFLEQIAEGGPVTVTHPDMTRYFMLIPEAVELVLQASAMADHGEVFILDMGRPVKIVDLARQLVFMSGNVPDVDIAIEFSGLRPGEKLFEELLIDESERRTAIDGITVGRPSHVTWDWLEHRIQALLSACARQDLEGMARNLRSLVTEWKPSERYRLALGDSDVIATTRSDAGSDSRRLAART
jgi:FlaA1/EpsC-like NDP-sugar epimerase